MEGQLTEDQKQDAIDFLRERPYFYNRSHSEYKDASKRNREWEFADQLGVPVAVITSWYRCMRAMLGRAKKAKTKSGSADVRLPRPRSMCGCTCSSWCPTSVRFHLTPWAPGRGRPLLNLSSLSLRLNSILTSLLQVGWCLDMLASTLQSVHDASATAPL